MLYFVLQTAGSEENLPAVLQRLQAGAVNYSGLSVG